MTVHRPLALVALVALASSPALARRQGGDIRSVDFRNFTYSYAGMAEEPTKIPVKNGKYESGDENDQLYFEVLDVVYGDLTGDGREEAVVQTLENTGGTGQFTDGLIFTMRDGKPEVVDSLGAGDRADGGIHDIRIEGGRIVVERYGQEHSGACCPEYVETSVLALKGATLVREKAPARQAYLAFESGKGPTRVRFLRGSSGAVLAGATNGSETFVLGARAGQTLSLAMDTKDAKATAVVRRGDQVVGTVRGKARWEGKLPAGGDYTISIASTSGQDSPDAYYTIALAIR